MNLFTHKITSGIHEGKELQGMKVPECTCKTHKQHMDCETACKSYYMHEGRSFEFEVLGCLPDITEEKAIELGFGEGRVTTCWGSLAEKIYDNVPEEYQDKIDDLLLILVEK